MEQFYRVRSPNPWGDYGSILVTGIACLESDGSVELERTGPFIPPISFPNWLVIVRDDFREVLELSQLAPFEFKPVVKTRIVDLNWTEWSWEKDLTANQHPPTGEPAGYVLDYPHSPIAADRMGPVWELSLKSTPTRLSYQEEFHTWIQHLIMDPVDWNGDPFFTGEFANGIKEFCCNDVGKSWLQAHAGKWVEFTPILTEPAPTREYYVWDRRDRVLVEPSVEEMREVLETLSTKSLATHGFASVRLGHRSMQVLEVSSPRWIQPSVTVEWTEIGEYGESEVWTLQSVSLEKALQLWIALSQGRFEELEQNEWE